MKKNIMMRIASILFVAVLMTTSAVSGTFAKYTSQATGTATVTVAKWSFTVGGADIAKTNTITFNLFNTNHTNVTNGKIAPGTSGSFQFALVNASEVTAKYTIKLSQSKSVPLKFSTDNSKWYSAADFSASANIAMNNGTANPTIYWKWDIDTVVNDVIDHTADTDLGLAAGALTVTATITAEQVD